MLDKLLLPGHPDHSDNNTAYCACSKCRMGLFGHFTVVYFFSFLSASRCLYTDNVTKWVNVPVFYSTPPT